jgi:hypothetical protein
VSGEAPDRIPALWKGPTILKPRDGASSENVIRFESRREAIEAIQEGRLPIERFRPEGYEIEEFIEGPILHIDGLVQYGKILTVLGSRYLGTCLGFAEGEPLGSVQLDPVRSVALFDWAQRVISAVEIRTGSFHLEAFQTPGGPVFLEIGARVGGADVVDTFELSTGIHLPSAELSLLVDAESRPFVPPPRLTPAKRYGWFVFPGHHLASDRCVIEGTETLRRRPEVVRWNQLARNRKLPRSITYQSREVPLAGVLGAETTEALEGLMKEIFTAARIVGFPTKAPAKAVGGA